MKKQKNEKNERMKKMKEKKEKKRKNILFCEEKRDLLHYILFTLVELMLICILLHESL
jgi:hypothetical protein